MSKTISSKPILVTGSHRSGSTWVGRILASAPKVAYIHEPFNLGLPIPVGSASVPNWFQHYSDDKAGAYWPVFNDILRFKYPLRKNVARIRSARNFAKVVKDQGRFLYHRVIGSRPLIKDPIAFFSAEWLSEAFDMNVLVVIRHPAAFCSSIVLKNWEFDFGQLINQPALMDKYLSPFREDIQEYSQDQKPLLEQAILLWNCIHHTVRIYQQEHADWLFVRHEGLSTDSIGEFKDIFVRLDLEFGKKTERLIRKYGGVQNPTEQERGKELFRDSKANIKNWQTRLEPDEILLIREKTREYASVFYKDDDWD